MRSEVRAAVLLLWFLVGLAAGRVWEVGPGRIHTCPSAVSGLVGDGDTVLSDPGRYADVCVWRADRLLLDATGLRLAEDKAIWVIKGDSTRVESIEFANASCPDQNGAGIRQEGTGPLVGRCAFHDNEDGILTGADSLSDIVVEFSEFRRNGYGTGCSHNLYIGHVRSFTLRHCWSHRARVGHQVKSRARENRILYNRIMDEDSGDASREIDLPNAGRSYVIGNLLHKGPRAENSNMIGFGLEGVQPGYDTVVYCVNNTMVNGRNPTGPFVQLAAGTRGVLVNNVFWGATEIVRGGKHQGNRTRVPVGHRGDDSLVGSVVGTSPELLDPDSFDCRLTSGSSCIDSGVMPDSLLRPVFHYVHPCSSELRPPVGIIDIGAYEYVPVGEAAEPTPARLPTPAVVPNPFGHTAVVVDSESSWFRVFDQSGRDRGLCRGDCIGSGLPAEVYFLVDQARPVPVVKLDAE